MNINPSIQMTHHPHVIALIRKLNESGFVTETFVRDTNNPCEFCLDFLHMEWSFQTRQKVRDIIDDLNDNSDFISEITVRGFHCSEDDGDRIWNAHLAFTVREDVQTITRNVLKCQN